MTQERPIPDSYWVVPGRLLAGEYPGAEDEEEALRKIGKLLGAGVTLFLDLTDKRDRLQAYRELLLTEAAALGCTAKHRTMPIPDYGVPSAEDMVQILDSIDAALEAGKVVYVHCWGGIGRTGTVVGCYMVRHGRSPEEAVEEIARLREGTPDGHRPAPQSPEQHEMVRKWPYLDTKAAQG